jgi:hypothetical protein
MIGDKKLDSMLTIKSGSGTMDSVTGNIWGKYVFERRTNVKDSNITVTVGFTWKK